MRGALQLRESYGRNSNLHDGIRFWDLDGASGYILEVVWFLRRWAGIFKPLRGAYWGFGLACCFDTVQWESSWSFITSS